MTMKRSLSDSDSDDCFDDVKDGSPGQSCNLSDRKKRRGIIEKRRRDRINNSLSELRRLVPAAFEKQGSAKLEKAEILQMTVDHLKVLHQKGSGNYNYPDPTIAMDYRSVGFRECVAEVARYLVTMEGLDIQDPLRLRLLSHLQCFSAQREVAKTSLQNNNWGSMNPHHPLNSQYNAQSMTSMLNQASDHLGMTSHSSSLSSVTCPEPRLSSGLSSHSLDRSHAGLDRTHSLDRMHGLDQHHPGMSSMRLPSAAGVAPQMSTASSSSLTGLAQVPSQYPSSLGMNSLPMLSPSGAHYSSSSASLPQGSKPYRPWGSELGAF